MKVRGVIFDVGGTLAWSNHDKFEEACAWSAVNVFRSHGFSGDTEALWRELLSVRRDFPKEGLNYRQIHTTRWAMREVALRHHFAVSDAFLERAEAAFVLPEAYGWVPLPGILDVVRWLGGRIKLGIVSNTRSHVLVEKTLEHLGVREVFDPLVTSTGCGWRKPSPRIFQKVLDAWKLPAEQIVMIGDSPTKDIAGAKALGMRTTWLSLDAPETSSPADAVAHTPLDIPRILAPWGVAD